MIIKQLIYYIRLMRLPLPAWVMLAGVAGGVFGLGVFTFAYGRGFSYMSDDPRACVNCHVMRDVFEGWNHGSHKSVAKCNDCHLPHNNIISKYAVKSLNGWHHSSAFTTGHFDEPIRIKKLNRKVAQHNCIRCHGEMTDLISHSESPEPTDCLRCHTGVGHR